MTPVIAIVGRPNVGKSTLFNRLTKSRDALVANYAGLTRDRIYGEGVLGDQSYILVDTGGISGEEEGIDAAMASQSLQAMAEADYILLVVDAQVGVTPADQMLVTHLRKLGKPYLLVINKTDGLNADTVSADFYTLGVPNLVCIAASQNRGVKSMIEEVLEGFEPEPQPDADEQAQGTRIAIIGRPNVGKSTLVNRMLGEERVVVFDQPGTTRDSVYIPYHRHDKPYTLIDTAGVRRRKNVKEHIEKFSIIKTLKAIEDAHVVVAVMDAREGVVDQDLHMLSFALEAGRALVIAINKWDGMTEDAKNKVRRDIERKLEFVGFADIKLISALHGTGVGDLYPAIDKAYRSSFAKWQTNKLTEILQDAVSQHMPPIVRGHRIKLRYAHQGGSNPPRIIIHGNQTESVPDSYRRYLENIYRRVLKVAGTPIFIEFKTGTNPFAGRKNKLTQRQLQRKRRLMKHVKKG